MKGRFLLRCVCALLAASWVFIAQTAAAAPAEPPLTIEDIRCEGNHVTPCDFIRQRLGFKSGSAVDEDKVRDAQLRLALLPRFTAVSIRLGKGSRRGLAILVIQVTESDPITTAITAGAAYRVGQFTQTFSAQVVDRDIFGVGRRLSLSVLGSTEDSGRAARESLARLQYYDPLPFGLPNYFLVAQALYVDSHYAYFNDSRFDNRFIALSLIAGRRIGDYSSLAVGFRLLPHASLDNVWRDDIGALESSTESPHQAAVFSYIRQSADDLNFPTHGSLLELFAEHDVTHRGLFFGGDYRETWALGGGGSYLTLQLQREGAYQFRGSTLDEPDFGIYYSHALSHFNLFSDTERARWYVGPGISKFGFDTQGHGLYEAGVRAGLRVQTKSLGVLHFYLAVDGSPFGRRN